jgi:hypothetical protein
MLLLLVQWSHLSSLMRVEASKLAEEMSTSTLNPRLGVAY